MSDYLTEYQATQVWESEGVNITPTEPGYCAFFDQIGCHAYMGGAWDGMQYRDDWTTCCGVDGPTPATPDYSAIRDAVYAEGDDE